MNCVSVSQLVHLVARHQVAVPAELAGCIVLAAADQVLRAPLNLDPADLLLFDDGIVRLSGGRDSDPATAEGSLRDLLGTLLRGASSVTPALMRAARRIPIGDLQAFVRELEIALVPTNRGASKRALSRLSREAKRALDAHSEQSEAPLPAAVPAPASKCFRSEQQSQKQTEVSIPDLDVPRQSKVHDLNSICYPNEADGGDRPFMEPDLLELTDEEVELLESANCPAASLNVVAAGASGEPALPAAAPEPTAPFPLIRLATPADPPAEPELPRARFATASSLIRRPCRVKRPIFTATQAPPEHTQIQVDTVLSPVGQVQRASDSGDLETHSTVLAAGVAREPCADARQPAASELKPKAPVIGPHRFVARACFAKKTSKVIERVSQFGATETGDSDQLLDNLQTLARTGGG